MQKIYPQYSALDMRNCYKNAKKRRFISFQFYKFCNLKVIKLWLFSNSLYDEKQHDRYRNRHFNDVKCLRDNWAISRRYMTVTKSSIPTVMQ